MNTILETCTKKNTPKFTLGGEFLCKCVSVYDGDTVGVVFESYRGSGFSRFSVRLLGVDTPEIRTVNIEEKKQGILARDFLRDLILNKIIFINVERKFDKYGRLLGTLYMKNDDKKSINAVLIEKGYAYSYNGGTKRKFGE